MLPLTPGSRLRIGPEGIEPSSGPYKRPALAIELRAREPVGPEGLEPPPYRLKGGYAAITPRPQNGRPYAFQSVFAHVPSLYSFQPPQKKNKKSRASCDTRLNSSTLHMKPGVTNASDARTVSAPDDWYRGRLVYAASFCWSLNVSLVPRLSVPMHEGIAHPSRQCVDARVAPRVHKKSAICLLVVGELAGSPPTGDRWLARSRLSGRSEVFYQFCCGNHHGANLALIGQDQHFGP